MEESTNIDVSKPSHWDLVIKPQAGLFDLHLKDVWRYRDLLFLFVKRDFVAQYKQTILGPLWHIIQPILTTCMFVLIFGRIANIPTDDIKPILFYLANISIWNYFSTCFNSTSNTFVSNANIFGKVYFPCLVIPLSVVVSNIVRFIIQFGLLIVVMIYYHFNGFPIQLNINWLWIPVLVIMMAGLGLGMGIIVSALTTKYRDLSILMTFMVQLLMYATPVVYPMSYLADKKYKFLIEINPLSAIVETFRYALFNKGHFYAEGLLYSALFMIVTLGVGLVVFNKVEKSFMDTV
jgi:lipopolysaccharide transport system permease protein